MRRANMVAIAAVCVVMAVLMVYLIRNGSSDTSVKISTDQTSIDVDETTQLTMENEDEDEEIDSDDDDLTWESSNKDIATVDSTGLVTGIEHGTVEITGTYRKSSDTITITVEEGGASARITSDADSIYAGQQTQLTFETEGNTLHSDNDLTWESSDTKIANVSNSGVVSGLKEGTVRIKGTYREKAASIELTVNSSDGMVDPITGGNSGGNAGGTNGDTTGGTSGNNEVIAPGRVAGLEAVSNEVIDMLQGEYGAGPWDSTRRLQAVEWNTDTMDMFYVCNARYITAYDSSGSYVTNSNDVGDAYMFSMDYYDGKLFSVMRSGSYGKFKLRIYDAYTLELLVSTDMADLHKQYEMDEKRYASDLIPSIDGITIAPQLGGGSDLKIYVSYNVYYSKNDGLALNEEQQIFEYDYESSIRNTKKIEATKRFSINLGPIEYGIQTLEYDRSTGNIWCAVRQGLSNYSLYCIDGTSRGSELTLVPNGTQAGWDCSHAGDGLCSLGNDWYYVLIPGYHDGYTDAVVQKVRLNELEYVG